MSFPALRDYQHRAVCAVAREIGLGSGAGYRKSTLVIQATGTGKTPIIGALTRLHIRRGGRRVLITAPREELLRHSDRWTRRWLPALRESSWGWEMAQHAAHQGTKIVLGSLGTLRQDVRLERMPEPDLILHDECHIDLGALDAIGERFPEARRVGLTATPDRSDLKAIMPDPFEAVHPDAIYEIGDAIAERNLVPIRGKRALIDGLDLEAVERAGEDFHGGSLGAAMKHPQVVDQTAKIALEETEGRQTIIFCCDLEHARAIEERLNAWRPESARSVSGEMPRGDRDEALGDFIAGRYRFVLTVVLFSYGIDAPPASCCLMARPTRSRALWTQSVGRGLRLFPEKADCLVIDLWGGTEQLSLVTPEEALRPAYRDLAAGQGELDESLRESMDVEADLELTHTERHVLAEPPPKAYRVLEVQNQIGFLGYEVGRRRHGEDGARYYQVLELQRLGVDHGDALSEDQAEELLDFLTERDRQGLCTFKQAKLLQRKGLSPMLTKELAGEAIGAIKQAGWRVPKHIRADARFRVKGARVVVTR